MKVSRILQLGMGLCVFSWDMMAAADNLLQVYSQAQQNDPTFKQAESTWWSAKQNLPIAVSAYLPQLSATYGLGRDYSFTKPAGATQGWFTQQAVTLSATQAIFNYTTWTNIQEQSAGVKSATATYMSAIQNLIVRTAQAYFNVLQAYDKLRFTIANKNAVKRQLVTSEQKFKVGLIAITSVYDAQSSYDQANAAEINDRNNLYTQLENLRAITGQHYVSLAGIPVQVPLVSPTPADIDTWVQTSEQQNYSLQASNFAAVQAQITIRNQASGYLPTLGAVAGYGNTQNSNYQYPEPGSQNTLTKSGNYGLALDWTPFSGGSTYFSTKQARYNYVTALGVLEFTHRNVVSQARQSYLGVLSGISQIQADKQSIVSAQNALKATQAGYLVGTRTMVDVLNDLTTVYKSENQYMDDQYTYVNNLINLKYEAGTLSLEDLQKINSWLAKTILLPLPTVYYSHVVGVTKTSYNKANQDINQDITHGMTELGEDPDSQMDVDATLNMAAPVTSDTPAPLAPPSETTTAPGSTNSTVKSVEISANDKPYTVQLYAADHIRAAERYVKQSKIQSLHVVKENGVYKVVYGQFKDRMAALIALDALPIDHAKTDAWVLRL